MKRPDKKRFRHITKKPGIRKNERPANERPAKPFSAVGRVLRMLQKRWRALLRGIVLMLQSAKRVTKKMRRPAYCPASEIYRARQRRGDRCSHRAARAVSAGQRCRSRLTFRASIRPCCDGFNAAAHDGPRSGREFRWRRRIPIRLRCRWRRRIPIRLRCRWRRRTPIP